MLPQTRKILHWSCGTLAFAVLAAGHAAAEVRVQDIAKLKGQRTNTLMGYGIVSGLNGTGDGGKYPATMRALMALHRRYEQSVLNIDDLKVNSNVALVHVEVTIPEFGAREGDRLDVIISAENAKSLAGGQLLTTPLQYAMFDSANPATMQVLALAGGGPIETPDADNPRRGIIRSGATLEADLFYSFVENGCITLVIDDEHAGWPVAHMLTRAINHEVANTLAVEPEAGVVVASTELAFALGPKNVRVRIPPQEMHDPTGFISRVLQTPMFFMPEQAARVVINRSTHQVSFTGTVTISPTVLQIPGLGTVAVGGRGASSAGAGPTDVVGLDTDKLAGVEFQELLDTLTRLKLTPAQTVKAVEQLHETGTLHAKLVYTE